MTTELEHLTEAARRALDAVGPAVVRIGRHGGRGCGVVVGDGLVATNAHNLRDRTTSVTFAGGRVEQAELAAADVDGDLAVLRVDTGEAPALQFTAGEVRAGDIVFAVARTPAGGERVSFGMVSATERAFRGPRGRRIRGSVEHTAPLPRGSSGSPLVAFDGAIVGLSTHRLGEGFYLALRGDESLQARIDALAAGRSRQRPTLGVAVAPPHVARKLRRAVGLPERDGLLVRGVEEGSPAEAAGIEVGDLLVAAAGRPLTSVDDLHDALEVGGALELLVVRGTEERPVTVTLPEADPDTR